MEFPAVSQLVNGSNNILRAENFEKYVKRSLFCQPEPIEQSDGGNSANSLSVFWTGEDSGCSPVIADIPISLPKSGTQKIKDSIQSMKFKDPCVLVQYWAPDQPAGRGCLLTTSNQPFGLTEINDELRLFRIASLKEGFYVNLEGEVGIGLIGRVFLKGSPEWIPNVQDYSRKEYPQLDEAVRCNVRGSLALPVFEDNGHCCLGVLEIVTTIVKESYDCEFIEICRALEGVNLKSSEVFPHTTKKVCRNSKAKAKSDVAVVRLKKKPNTKTSGITYEDLSRLFDKPRYVAAVELKISKSTFRNKCRQLGIIKWPYKKRTRGSYILGKYDKETLRQTELDTTPMEDLSTLSSEDDYGAEIMDDQYPAEVFEPTSLGLLDAAETDELGTLPMEDESGGKVMDDQSLKEVFEPISLVEPDATATEDLIHVSKEEEYGADQNLDELSFHEFCAQLGDIHLGWASNIGLVLEGSASMIDNPELA